VTLRAALTLAIAVVALLATGTVASAGTGSTAGPRPPAATLYLTIATDLGLTADASLTCAPAGGRHPHPARACRDLARAAGDLDRLPARPLVCTMVYRPVTAAADGTWHGNAVRWQRTFPNSCLMRAATGAVFRF
jgi:hypothetical protein